MPSARARASRSFWIPQSILLAIPALGIALAAGSGASAGTVSIMVVTAVAAHVAGIRRSTGSKADETEDATRVSYRPVGRSHPETGKPDGNPDEGVSSGQPEPPRATSSETSVHPRLPPSPGESDASTGDWTEIVDRLVRFQRDHANEASECVDRARKIINDAIHGLATSFEQLRSGSSQQNESSVRLIESLEAIRYRANPSGGYDPPPFVAATTELLDNFVRYIVGVSKGSLLVADGIDDARSELERIRDACRQSGRIADQTTLLALNSKIKAKAAGEHGEVFVVIADEVCALASEAREFNEGIQQRVSDLGEAFDRLTASVGTLADRDMTDTIVARGHLDEMFDEIGKVNRHLERSLNEFASVAARLDGDVETSVRSLQFEDIVGQLLGHAQRILEGAVHAQERLVEMSQTGLPSADFRSHLDESRAQWKRSLRRPVESHDMGAGEVELF